MAHAEEPILDHIAVRVQQRDEVVAELRKHLDLRILQHTERLTLLGVDMSAGKLTLLDAGDHSGTGGGHGRPAVDRLVSVAFASSEADAAEVSAPMVLECGLVLTFAAAEQVPAGTVRHAVVGATLRSADPPMVAAEYVARYGLSMGGMQRDMARLMAGVEEGGGTMTLVREPVEGPGAPYALDHIGLRVEHVGAWEERADHGDIEALDVVDGEISRALFVAGPEQVKLEFIEHIPASVG